VNCPASATGIKIFIALNGRLHRGKLAVKQWSGWLRLFPADIRHPFLPSLCLVSHVNWPFLGTNCGAPYTAEGVFVMGQDRSTAIETRESRERFLVSPYGERQMCTPSMKFSLSARGERREGGFVATEFSLRIRHPKPHDEESRTHRRQNLDASRLRAREFRGRRSTAGLQTGIEVFQVLLMGGIKKWAAPWMCRGPI
ncbi:hypothetical protein ALC62_01409, partial [Cyphomyrmex costatus]